jgi:hypothetical protein
MGDKRNANDISVQEPAGKRPRGRLMRRGEDDIKMYVREISMLGGSLVTTAWRVLRLRMEGSPPVTEGSCEYIE